MTYYLFTSFICTGGRPQLHSSLCGYVGGKGGNVSAVQEPPTTTIDRPSGSLQRQPRLPLHCLFNVVGYLLASFTFNSYSLRRSSLRSTSLPHSYCPPSSSHRIHDIDPTVTTLEEDERAYSAATEQLSTPLHSTTVHSLSRSLALSRCRGQRRQHHLDN
jgi:hypothetical protein